MKMFVFLSVVGLVSFVDAGVDAQKFWRILKELHAPFHDVSLVCEGSSSIFGPPGIVNPEQPIVYEYQSRYSYREDGRFLLDTYERSPLNKTMHSREQLSLIDGRIEARTEAPDQGFDGGLNQSWSGSAGVFNRDESPHRYFWVPQFREWSGNPAWAVEVLGEEPIDGRPCLHVRIRPTSSSNEGRNSRMEFWIDMERGGHPLRVDMYRGGGRFLRVRDIRLEQIPTDGGNVVWFPVAATGDGYESSEGLMDEPTSLLEYAVVNGSVRINQGLANSAFELETRPNRQSSPEMAPLERELDARRQANSVRPRRVRTDAVSVQVRLDAALAEADAQARQIDASVPGRQRDLLNSGIRWGLVAFGLGVAALAWHMARKGR